jgi:nucleoside-diphosphate-sugar epimerase
MRSRWRIAASSTSSELSIFTSYGITKTAGEQLMMMSPIPTVSLRLANVTGPRLAIGPIPSFYKINLIQQNNFSIAK